MIGMDVIGVHIQNREDMNPDFQRPPVWSRIQKQLRSFLYLDPPTNGKTPQVLGETE
jgi:hypothetical protein